MGIIRNGANGGFSGKAGSVVGSSWKNVNYIKGLSKRRKGASSQLQLETQAKFAAAIRFLKPIKDLLNLTYASIRSGRAMGFNMALRHVIKLALHGNYPTYEVDYPAVQFAVGSLAEAVGTVVADGNASIRLTWDSEPNPYNAYDDDKLTVLIYDPQTNVYKSGPLNLTRVQGEAVIQMRPEMIGKELHVYFFFTSRDGKKLSPSWYAGTVTVTSSN